MENVEKQKLQKDSVIVCISQQLKCISFEEIGGFQKSVYSSNEEMWSSIWGLIDNGFKVR